MSNPITRKDVKFYVIGLSVAALLAFASYKTGDSGKRWKEYSDFSYQCHRELLRAGEHDVYAQCDSIWAHIKDSKKNKNEFMKKYVY